MAEKFPSLWLSGEIILNSHLCLRYNRAVSVNTKSLTYVCVEILTALLP